MITVSIETANKLKKKGYPQNIEDSIFKWYKLQALDYALTLEEARDRAWYDESKKEYYNAPTAQELMESMPDSITDTDHVYSLTVIKVNNNYWVAYNELAKPALISFDGNYLCECLANLWLWCKKEGYIK